MCGPGELRKLNITTSCKLPSKLAPCVAVSSNCHISLGERVSISHRAYFFGVGETGRIGQVRGRIDWPTPISLLVPGEEEVVRWRGWCPRALGGDSEQSGPARGAQGREAWGTAVSERSAQVA